VLARASNNLAITHSTTIPHDKDIPPKGDPDKTGEFPEVFILKNLEQIRDGKTVRYARA
jgi:hypothetical protein